MAPVLALVTPAGLTARLALFLQALAGAEVAAAMERMRDLGISAVRFSLGC